MDREMKDGEGRVVGLLIEIRDRLDRLCAAAERRKPAGPTEAEAAVLREIHRRVAGRAFTVPELLEHIRATDATQIAEAIEAACGAVSARRLGKLFGRLEGEDAGGLIVLRRGVERTGVVWSVQVCGYGNSRKARRLAIA
jgi:hypothetical protein